MIALKTKCIPSTIELRTVRQSNLRHCGTETRILLRKVEFRKEVYHFWNILQRFYTIACKVSLPQIKPYLINT